MNFPIEYEIIQNLSKKSVQIVRYALQKSAQVRCAVQNTVKVLSTRCYITANMLSKNCAKYKENSQYGVFQRLSISGSIETCKICHQI